MRSCASRNEEEGGSEELEKGMVRREALSSAWRIKGVQKRIINRISGGPKKSRRPASHMIRGATTQGPTTVAALLLATAHRTLGACNESYIICGVYEPQQKCTLSIDFSFLVGSPHLSQHLPWMPYPPAAAAVRSAAMVNNHPVLATT